VLNGVYMLLVALSVPALRVGTLRMQQSEDAAKAAWLARTAADAPSWGPKGGTPVAAAPAAPPAAAAPATTEEEAKAAWLARVAADAPSWGASAGAAPAMTEEAAKAAWLARLDAPSWGQASTTMSEVAGQASALLALTEDCDSGVEAACDTLSREEEAKRAWLASLDVPAWGAAAAAVSAVASQVSAPAAVSEEEAKQAWLARLDAPTWGKGVVSPTGGAAASPARLSEDEAKRAWLARLDAPTWGTAAAAVTQVAAEAERLVALEQDCNTGVDAACDALAREDEAKRAWLAKLDVPAWGAAAKAVTAVAVQVAPGGVLDAPAWTPPATAAEISVQATANKQEMRGRTWGDHQVY